MGSHVRSQGLAWLLPLLTLLMCLLSLSPAAARAQDDGPSAPFSPIRQAIIAGNAKVLLSYSSERVEINLFGRSGVYSPSQAVYVVQDFFQKYPPKQFAFRDTSHTRHSWFVGGIYQHARNNAPLRIYLRIRSSDRKWKLREIHISHFEPGQ